MPQGVDRHAYFGFPDENYLRDVQITEPQICSNVSVSTPAGGYFAALPTSAFNTAQPCAYTPSTPASQMTVNRNQIQIKSVECDLWDQTEVTARFKLAGVGNDFAGGVEGGREVSNPVRYSYTENKINSVTPTNLAAPTPQDVFPGVGYIASVTHVTSESVGLYFVYTLKLGRFIEMSGGVRWDYFETLFNLYDKPTSVVGASLTAPIAPVSQTVEKPTGQRIRTGVYQNLLRQWAEM